MILTLTANPSLDRTIELGSPLAHGAVQRAVGAVQDPGGKGVNISRALHTSQVPTVAVVPGEATDPVLTAHKFEGNSFCLSEFDRNVQGMGNNDAVAAGLETKVF